jgi:chromosome partitioning protein
VIAIANQKGGVGKSTTAVNLGASLAEDGKRVLVIDLDPQGNASTGVGVGHSDRLTTIYEVITAGLDIHDAVLPTDIDHLSVVPSTIDLAGAEIELVSQFSREARLAKALDPVRSEYDFILLDCPPSLGLLTINALTAADELIVPIQCEYYALEGLGQLLKNVRLVQQNVNPRLRLSGIVMTMFDSRTKLADQVVAEVRAYFGARVYDAIIPRSVRLAEAPGFGKTILQYDPGSKGAVAYRQLAKELVTKGAGDGLLDVDLSDVGKGLELDPPLGMEAAEAAAPDDSGSAGSSADGSDGLSSPALSSLGPSSDETSSVAPDARGGAAGLSDASASPASESDSVSQEDLETDGHMGESPRMASSAPAPQTDGEMDAPAAQAGAGSMQEGEHSVDLPGEDQDPRQAETLEQRPSNPETVHDRPVHPETFAEAPADTDALQQDSGGPETSPAPEPEATPPSAQEVGPTASAEQPGGEESAVPQAFSSRDRLVHIVSDEWEGLGISEEEDLAQEGERSPQDANQVPDVLGEPGPAGVEWANEGKRNKRGRNEGVLGKLRRWLFGNTDGGGS